MPQEADAIDRVQALVLAANSRDLKTNTPTVILPGANGTAAIHSLEPYMTGRSRFRGAMSTQSVKDFVKYVIDRKGNPRGFIDAEKIQSMTCRVFFNLGDTESPGHADDVAVLKPKELAAFTALRAVSGKSFSQRELTDWIEDWNHILTASTGDTQMAITAAVSAIRNMKIVRKGEATSKVGDNAISRSAMDEVEAKSVETMPGKLYMETAPFDGFKTRTFILRIATLTGEGEPKLTLRWQAQEPQCEEIAQEFKEILVRDLGGMADSLVVGTFDANK